MNSESFSQFLPTWLTAGRQRRTARTIAIIRDRADELSRCSTDQLQKWTARVRDRYDSLAAEQRKSRFRKQSTVLQTDSLALITEAMRRTTEKTYYDVQLMGGIELSAGRVAQMQTGEGKTITAALPAFVRATERPGVHIATTNSYLAARDSEELRPAFELLGLTVGLLPEDNDDQAKRRAYSCDITFGTGFDFAFDFLRDQVTARSRPAMPLGSQPLADFLGIHQTRQELIQPQHSFVVVDEADSVLVDEATMPMILSSPSTDPPTADVFRLAARATADMQEPDHFELDRARREISVTEAGWLHAYDVLQSASSLPLVRHWSVYIQNALRAQLILQRDVDYVVQDDAIRIVDQHTGRIHDERTWRDGLHQAIEIKENVTITSEAGSTARVTRQHYFGLYGGMAGMTGTAVGVEHEFRQFYGLSTSVIPTHRPSQRRTLPLRCFADDNARNAAVAAAVQKSAATRRPVLIGTRTIRHSRTLAEQLTARGIAHTVLNGLQDEAEADVISQAGQAGAVTIATNMAGRGTDIKLTPEARQAGGLHVIGAELNLSRRVDRQLAGRAARQGDPGSCRFFAAADDEVFAYDADLSRQMTEDARSSGECRSDFTADVDRLQDDHELRSCRLRQQMVNRETWLDDILHTLAGRGA